MVLLAVWIQDGIIYLVLSRQWSFWQCWSKTVKVSFVQSSESDTAPLNCSSRSYSRWYHNGWKRSGDRKERAGAVQRPNSTRYRITRLQLQAEPSQWLDHTRILLSTSSVLSFYTIIAHLSPSLALSGSTMICYLLIGCRLPQRESDVIRRQQLVLNTQTSSRAFCRHSIDVATRSLRLF